MELLDDNSEENFSEESVEVQDADHFPFIEDETERLIIPQEDATRKQKNNYPKKIFKRDTLNSNETSLFSFYQENCSSIKNPFTLSRRTNRQVNTVTVSSMISVWTNIIMILDFSEDLTMVQVFWKLVRPKTIKKMVSIAHKHKMAKNTMRHIIEYCYRLAWLLDYTPFYSFIGVRMSDSILNGKIACLGAFFNATLPTANNDGKESVRDHRTLSSMINKGKWCEVTELTKVAEELAATITASSPKCEVRDACIFTFYATNPPPRAQNLRLLVVDGNELSNDVVQNMVATENLNFTPKKLSNCGFSGVIFSNKTSAGYYKIIWTCYKTFTSYGVQTRTITHPSAVDLFTIWFSLRNTSNNCLWQAATGLPFYNVSSSFSKITLSKMKKNISIGDWRIITNTKMKKEASNENYLRFIALCLHSESVSNKYYVKDDVDLLQEKELSEINAILGSTSQKQVSDLCAEVKCFLMEDSTQLAKKIMDMKNFITSYTTSQGMKENNDELFAGIDISWIDPPSVSLQTPSLPAPTENLEIAVPFRNTRSPLRDYLNPVTGRFHCPKCLKPFSEGKNLKKHIVKCSKYAERKKTISESHHEIEPSFIPLDEESSSSEESNLDKKEKPSPTRSPNAKYYSRERLAFICPHCKKESKASNNLTRHIKICLEIKQGNTKRNLESTTKLAMPNFSNPIALGKTFSADDNILTVPLVDTSLTPMLPPDNDTFTTRSSNPSKASNAKHYSVEQKSFICPLCFAKLAYSNTLTRHMKNCKGAPRK
jgi:hypothetical protein